MKQKNNNLFLYYYYITFINKNQVLILIYFFKAEQQKLLSIFGKFKKIFMMVQENGFPIIKACIVHQQLPLGLLQ